MNRSFIAASLIALAVAGLGGGAMADDKENWTPLFNGKDLSGWDDTLDNGSSWEVTDGIIEGRGGGLRHPAVLVTERQDFSSNYKLRVQFGCRSKPGGAAIELRRSSPREGVTSSYMVSAAVNPHWFGSARPSGNVLKMKNYRYGSPAPPARESAPVGAAVNHWHTLEITVAGDTITTFVNGRKADTFTDRKRAFRSGGIALFICGDSVVQFKEVAIQELPGDGPGEPDVHATGRGS